MIWSVPFCAGIVLFAPDLVEFVLGDEWEPAVVLLQGLAVATALQQLGFNWFSFYRARGDSRPQAVEAGVMAVAFLALAVPGLALWGATGFVVGRGLVSLAMLVVRARYVHRLLPGVRLWVLGAARRCARGRGGRGRARAAARALGRWAAALAGAVRAGALPRRDRARHAAARARPAARVHALPANGQPDAGRGVRIGLYDPHLATLGGGERYFLTVLEEALRLPDAQVTLLSPERPDPAAWRRLGIEVAEGSFEWSQADDAAVTALSPQLDLLFAMVNEVPPRSGARRSVAMVQFPHRSHTGPRARLLRALRVSRAPGGARVVRALHLQLRVHPRPHPRAAGGGRRRGAASGGAAGGRASCRRSP